MTIVEDDIGRRYLVVKRSSSASLLQSLETGERAYHSNDSFESIEEERFDGDIPEELRTLLADNAIHFNDYRLLKVVTLLQDGNPVMIRTILAQTTLCESDLFAILRELEIAGLVEEVTIGDERARQLTPTAKAALDQL